MKKDRSVKVDVRGGLLELGGRSGRTVDDAISFLSSQFILTSMGVMGFTDDVHALASHQIRWLDASHCQGLVAIPKKLSAMKYLEVLDLSNNELVLDVEAVQVLQRLPKLSWLYLRGNPSLPRRLAKNVGVGNLSSFLKDAWNFLSCVGARKACLCVLAAHKRRSQNCFANLPRDVVRYVIVAMIWKERLDIAWDEANKQHPE
jgi:hypothetical protein